MGFFFSVSETVTLVKMDGMMNVFLRIMRFLGKVLSKWDVRNTVNKKDDLTSRKGHGVF